jgi:hypothetical protein
MYEIKIDGDVITLKEKMVNARLVLEIIGEEPEDCELVSENNIVFKGAVDLSVHKKFKTVHPDFIPKCWLVVN